MVRAIRSRIFIIWLAILFLLPESAAASRSAPVAGPPSEPPVLINPGFECGDGYHDQPGIQGMVANGWTAVVLSGADPFMCSTQMWAREGSCDPNDYRWEKLDGHDSYIFMASYARLGNDFPAPPFDIALYQPVDVAAGVSYSLSAWMVSLCGGSGPTDTCPTGAYIAKMAGLDPTGGLDPLAQTVEWSEDRRSHWEAGWTNLSLATTAQNSKLAVFVRIDSPYQARGNHAFADAVKLVRSPSARFTSIVKGSGSIAVAWQGDLGPDIPTIPNGDYAPTYEVQYRKAPGAWQSWKSGEPAGSALLDVPGSCTDQAYTFRVRAIARQIPGPPGAWPDHRFVGPWEDSEPVTVAHALACPFSQFLPMVQR